MEIKISKSELGKLLHVTQAIAEKKSTMPILANLLLRAEGNSFSITGSDLEITAVATAAATVKSKGAVTVNGKIFSEIVRELPDGDVTIKSTERERVEIVAGRSQLKMIGVSADEYPVPPGLSLSVRSKLPASQLIEMISKTIYAVSLDEGRYTMSGICLETIKEGKTAAIRMVATDGHRLALITRPAANLQLTSMATGSKKSAAASTRDHVIIPRKGMVEIRKALETNPDAEVGLDVNEGFFVVETGNSKLVVRLIDGEFPDYAQVLPANKGERATVLSNELSQALKRVALMVSDKNKGVRLDFGENSVRITSSSAELGEAREELAIQYLGKPFTVGFNAKYIIDVISTITETQPLVMELFGETGPGKFFTEADESSISIVMPLRLD